MIWRYLFWRTVERELEAVLADQPLRLNAPVNYVPWGRSRAVIARCVARLFAQCIVDRASSLHIFLVKGRMTYVIADNLYEMAPFPVAILQTFVHMLADRAGLDATNNVGTMSLRVGDSKLILRVEYAADRQPFISIMGFDRSQHSELQSKQARASSRPESVS